MPQNNTDDATDEQRAEQRAEPHTGRRLGSLGTATVKIDVSADTYQTVHEAYCAAVDAGYSDDFATFAHNYCATEYVVTVGGEPVDPDLGEHV